MSKEKIQYSLPPISSLHPSSKSGKMDELLKLQDDFVKMMEREKEVCKEMTKRARDEFNIIVEQ